MLEGKCFYRQQGWWTFEFCFKSHVRQFHMDTNTEKITEEFMLGYYNASNSYEASRGLASIPAEFSLKRRFMFRYSKFEDGLRP